MWGSSGDGIPATDANISPQRCTVDKHGNLYFTDQENIIRKVDAAGIITTIAGTGTAGYNGDGIPATAAELMYPEDIAIDTNGNVYFTDNGNNRLRRIDANTNIITTVADAASLGLSGVAQMCFDPFGNIYVSDYARVVKLTPSGTSSFVAGSGVTNYFAMSTFPPMLATSFSFNTITAITVDFSGNLYLYLHFRMVYAPTSYTSIVKINPAGILTRYAGTGYFGNTGDGGAATAAKIGGDYTGMVTDRTGNLYFTTNDGVRKIDTSGVICTVAGNGTIGYSGDGSTATLAQMNLGNGITLDTSNNLYISDQWNWRIRKVTQPTCANIYPINVSEVEKVKQLSIFPQPATSKLNINAPYPISTISISNLIGQTEYAGHYNNAQVQVDVSGLPVGMHLINVNNTEFRRFIKQ